MASLGAKVLQTRSVALAMQHRVRVQVLSSFADLPGTLVVDEGEIVESQIVSGIAYSRDEARVTVLGVRDRPGVAASIFGPLSEHGINVDMIVQSVSRDGVYANLTFTVSRADLQRALWSWSAPRPRSATRISAPMPMSARFRSLGSACVRTPASPT